MKSRSFAVAVACTLMAITGLVISPAQARETMQRPPEVTLTTVPETSVDDVKLLAAKKRGDEAIEKRLSALSSAQARVNEAERMTADHKTALLSQIATTISGLTSLKGKIDASSTLAEALTHMKSITRDYRVYVVVEPQVHLVRAADANTAAVADMEAALAQLNNATKLLKDAGKNTESIEAQLSIATAALQSAKASVDGQADKAIALKPAEWPNNRTTLKSIRENVRKASTEDAKASTALVKAAQLIKAAI